VVRHHLVQRIIRAYEDKKKNSDQLDLALEAKPVANGGSRPKEADQAQIAPEMPPPGSGGNSTVRE
jgi:hypothetical protein